VQPSAACENIDDRGKELPKKTTVIKLFQYAALFGVIALFMTGRLAAEQPQSPAGQAAADATDCDSAVQGSPYIPVDSWIYPAMLRLYSLGYVDTVYLNLRPWTRASVDHMLEETADRIEDAQGVPGESEAEGIYDAVKRELRRDPEVDCSVHKGRARVESVYTMARGMSGTPLRDSFHLGSTIVNDYGRPYSNGFNNYSGASGYASAGRFVVYVRGEFEGTPSTAGYSSALAGVLFAGDGKSTKGDQTDYYYTPSCWLNTGPSNASCVPMPYKYQATIPFGAIGTTTTGRVLEAYVSAQYLNHVFSFGKQDEWQGPGLGGAMSYSNNADNVYAFHINRIEPLYVPLLSKLTGPFRYNFLIGPLRGHTYPIDPWVHLEKISFRPTENVEFGFERTVIWGGKGHEPVNLKSFLRSFFSLSAPATPAAKDGPTDPGARFGAFDFSYRLPFLRNWVTLYSDSEVHDDVSPIDAPRRASWRPGIYLSHVPGISKLDLRLEGAATDPPVQRSVNGQFMYWEEIQRQGYTNSGQLFGDWIGREDKGGQGWITYHLSGNEWIQVSMRHQKAEKDFIPGGTTLNDFNAQIVKRLGRDLEIDGSFKFEHWKVPVYLPTQQTVTSTAIQITWYPDRKVSF
jgi:hypothetical protein